MNLFKKFGFNAKTRRRKVKKYGFFFASLRLCVFAFNYLFLCLLGQGLGYLSAEEVGRKWLYETIDLSQGTHRCDPVFTFQSPDAQRISIPRRLFQTWKTHTLPDAFAAWSQTWRAYNPLWEFELWDDADNRAFIKTYFPWFLPRYDSYPREIYRADSVRYFYLYYYGGIYADLDFECLKSLEPLLDENCVILGKMSQVDHDHNLPNAFMASPPKADFWLVVIHGLLHAPKDERPEYVTGPVILRQAWQTYQDKKKRLIVLDEMKNFMPDAVAIPIQIRPPCELYPFDWTTSKYVIFPCSYAVTWWSHSW